MSRWLRKPCLIGIGMHEVLTLSPERAGSSDVLAVAPLDPAVPGTQPGARSWATPFIAAMEAAAKHTNAVHVTVGDDWMRYWYITPPEGLGSLAELRAMLSARFEDLFGISASRWVIEADWKSGGGVFASAMSVSMRDSLRAAAAESKVRLLSVVPATVRLFNRYAAELSDDCWFCCCGERTVTALQFEAGALVHVRRFRYDNLPDVEDTVERLEAEALRRGTNMPKRVFFAGQIATPASANVGSVQITILGRGLAATHLRGGHGPLTEEATQLAFAGRQL